jgi:hypothetical protein
MAKRPSENSVADRSFRHLKPEDFTYPEGEPSDVKEAEGQPNWASVRSRRSGIYEAIGKQKEIDKLKAELEAKEKGEELIIGGQ